jgi:hypothetical protein
MSDHFFSWDTVPDMHMRENFHMKIAFNFMYREKLSNGVYSYCNHVSYRLRRASYNLPLHLNTASEPVTAARTCREPGLRVATGKPARNRRLLSIEARARSSHHSHNADFGAHPESPKLQEII